MARPGATWLEYTIIAIIFQDMSQWNSVIGSHVWAREEWKNE